MSFNHTIERLVDEPAAHARFVNTLSLLEYIGARKILKSQDASGLSMQILGHAAEEMRHAQILKGLALHLSEGLLSTYAEEHLLCGPEARAYFQSLDQACAASVPGADPKVVYVLTTLLIEERAMKIYPAYESILRKRGIPNALKALIKDEDKHLAEMQAVLKGVHFPEASLDRLRELEERYFQDFLVNLVSACEL